MVDAGEFLELPAVCDPLTARIAENAGFRTLYNGGFVSGSFSAVSEPLMTMSEQIAIAANIARTVNVPLVMDAGAGWGEPLHTMRTVRECIRNGVAGVHIEDQLFPKRAHYHTYVAHNIPRREFRDKIKLACEQRDRSDPDFVIIARSDAHQSGGRSRRRHGTDFSAHCTRNRANAEAVQAADGVCAKPRQPRRPSTL